MTTILDLDQKEYIYSDNSTNMSQNSQDDIYVNSPEYSLSPMSHSSNEASNLYNNIQNLNLANNSNNNEIFTCLENSIMTPHLKIVEQPVDKFRFRYRSEMHGTHGSLMAQRSDKSKKLFPTVKLCGYAGDAIIRCSLYQVEENKLTMERSQHSHKLVVRNGDEDREDPHDVHVSSSKGYAAVFRGMGIIHTAKKSIAEELYQKKKHANELSTNRDLSSREDVMLKNSAEEEAKAMNLNQVCLCYQAFTENENGVMTQLCSPIYSNTINNMKSALTGELKITRLSVAVSSAAGGDDLFLFVEKVGKKNIRVRFYEVNEDDQEIWEDWGKFTEADVHHQYAIALRTPPYRDVSITQSVDVFIQLHRINDSDRSEPLPFRYKPANNFNSRKRQRTCSNFNSLSSGSNVSSVEIPMFVTHGNFELQQLQKQNMTISAEFKKSDIINDFLNIESQELQDFSKLLDSKEYKLLFDDLKTDGCVPSAAMEDKKKQKNLSSIEKERQLPGEMMKRIAEIIRQHRTDKTKTKELILELLKPMNEDSGDNVIHIAIKYGDDNAFQKYLMLIKSYDLNELVNSVNNLKQNYLNYACAYDRYEYIKHLISLGTNTNNSDYKGNTPLHNAVDEQSIYCIQILLDSENYVSPKSVEIKIDCANHDGLTPLQFAIRKKNFEIVKVLLKSGASSKLSESKHGDNILHIAVYENAADIVEYILENTTIKINDVNNSGYTPLQIACASQNKSDTQIVKLLLKYGGNPKIMNINNFGQRRRHQQQHTDPIIKFETDEDEDDDNEDEENENSYDSFDLARNKPEILRVLHDFVPIEAKTEILSESSDNDDEDERKLIVNLKTDVELMDTSDSEIENKFFNKTNMHEERALKELYEIFNKTNKWKNIANLLHYDAFIRIWENSQNPTEMLFNYIELDNVTFGKIITLFKEINQLDAIPLIQNMMKKSLK